MMTYQSLQEQIEEILEQLGIHNEEKHVMASAYINPGSTMRQICKTANISISANQIQDLSQKGLVLKREVEGKEQLYPIPLVLLIQQHGQHLDDLQKVNIMEAMKTIDKWIKYPMMTANTTKLKSSAEKDTVLQWLFDLHATEWERVYCFGDYEAFIDSIGINPEVEWIKERAKKGRKASVVATKDGQWAQRIESQKSQELRDCLINPGEFSGLFIMAFPEIQTTVLGSADGDITFVQSDSVTKQYAELVQSSLTSQ